MAVPSNIYTVSSGRSRARYPSADVDASRALELEDRVRPKNPVLLPKSVLIRFREGEGRHIAQAKSRWKHRTMTQAVLIWRLSDALAGGSGLLPDPKIDSKLATTA